MSRVIALPIFAFFIVVFVNCKPQAEKRQDNPGNDVPKSEKATQSTPSTGTADSTPAGGIVATEDSTVGGDNSGLDGDSPGDSDPDADSTDTAEVEDETKNGNKDDEEGKEKVKDGHIVFLSSATYTGNLGGLSGADAKCQLLADDAELAGDYKAMLSADNESAADRLTLKGKLKDVDGKLISNDASGIWGQTISRAINMDEEGNTINANQNTHSHNNNGHDVWTGSNQDGNAMQDNCANWNTSNRRKEAKVGNFASTGLNWFAARQSFGSRDIDCDEQARLYCISQ